MKKINLIWEILYLQEIYLKIIKQTSNENQ